MADCTATLTTATVHTDSDHCQFGPKLDCYHNNCIKVRGRWVHVELDTMTCVDYGDHSLHRNDFRGKTLWRDDTPGATPHEHTTCEHDEWGQWLQVAGDGWGRFVRQCLSTPDCQQMQEGKMVPDLPTSTVTDAEVQAAFEVIYDSPRTTTSDHVRAALEAAAAVRAAQEVGDE